MSPDLDAFKGLRACRRHEDEGAEHEVDAGHEQPS
jgi:hypothetical protein